MTPLLFTIICAVALEAAVIVLLIIKLRQSEK